MNKKRCKVGVPQGSKLGLVLSLVMVNNLMMIFKQEALSPVGDLQRGPNPK